MDVLSHTVLQSDKAVLRLGSGRPSRPWDVYVRYILKKWLSAKTRSMRARVLNGMKKTRTRIGRHQVTPEEAEDVFFNEPLVIRSDVRHSKQEKRYYALGQTSGGRCLFVAFTIRHSLLRVISVRDMNRKEREAYAKREEEAGA